MKCISCVWSAFLSLVGLDQHDEILCCTLWEVSGNEPKRCDEVNPFDDCQLAETDPSWDV